VFALYNGLAHIIDMWFQNLTNSSYVPNSTLDSLVADRVVSLDLVGMGILCVIISLLSVVIFYTIMQYLKNTPK
jgi:hypothetical protein